MSLVNLAELVRLLWKPVVAVLTIVLVVSWVWNFFNEGTIRLTVTPSPAQVTIGSSRQMVTDVTEIKLGPGKYSLLVHKEGFLDYRATVSISPRQVSSLSVNLSRPPAKLAASAHEPALTADSQAVRYIGADNLIHEVSLAGVDKTLSSLVLPEILNFGWSPDRSRFFLTTYNRKFQLQHSGSLFFSSADADLAAVTWSYDLSTGKLTRLAADLGGFTWSATGQALFYSQTDGTHPAIYEVNSDGSGVQKIVATSSPEVVISPAPDGRSLVWYSHPEGFGQVNLHLVSLTTKQDQPITTDGYSYGARWSPDGTEILTNIVDKNNFKTSLATVTSGGVRKEWGVAGDAEKATWGAGSDLIYQVNGSAKTIESVKVQGATTAELIHFDQGLPTNLTVSLDGSALVYIYQGSLYLLKLR